MSCFMGFFIWYSVSNSRTITRTISVPIYFTDSKADIQINAPESTQITIAGTRGDIQKTVQAGAIHFEGSQLSVGKKTVRPTYKNFLLPSAVKVLNYMPIEVSITPREQ
jgi:hypothetical protein